MALIGRLMRTQAPAAVILVRLLTGSVFFAEGLKKFLFAADWGAGRFARIGIPAPEILGPFVGVVEIVCGLLLVIGLLTRPAAIALIINTSVAIYTTKLSILFEKGFGGFWEMEDKARTDYSMLLCLLFLLIVGAGRWSMDASIARGKG
jgi:putative oxidoreductase